ncbi:hypothetical protein C3941_12230 [Kaistia algarum]|nr:hypothetical protein C3941_12230 [Kaistia algarum]
MMLAGSLILSVLPYSAVAAETGTVIRYCHGYGCAMRSPVRLSGGDLATLRRMLASGSGSPSAERAAIGRADQWFERLAGRQTGTSKDGAKDVYQLFTPPSEIDCVDEATNTTTLLNLIQSRGWLRHHKVGSIDRRGFLVDGRYPHHTATIRDKSSGVVWVVDSWVRANGEPPDIKPLSVWKDEGGLRG